MSEYYGTLTKANTYFATERVGGSVWQNYDSTHKLIALKDATRRIDRLNYTGERTVDSQALEFPRDGDTEVPEHVELACYEIAFELLVNAVDTQIEITSSNVVSSTFMGGNEDRDIESQHPAMLHGIPSVVAWNYLLPYFRDVSFVKLSRLS